ncbi:chromosome segregation and condensation protein ScpA [Methanococcus aeolicus Nankai-3]|uniref:Chromosome segregation and condensation protein ScpA n=1 Tax=Methanococcus aeolicus (strain ATCC BAA-1280 / DSM 17508 / OCM 812 / Nankai-3) TaxID=419665 RepID=A6UVS8_META3|nr:segregation/condensation protein A [Methanococcus aeolicus]ABR56600.1 chromosome segregation and condensation protein ScpA [Methanococcus aeolicus Nankai-3]
MEYNNNTNNNTEQNNDNNEIYKDGGFELWIRIIKESIDKKNIEPWNINISEIADEYIKTIRELRQFDIRLSADVVLVGSVLLRMKSQILYGECENTFNDDKEDLEIESEGEEFGEYYEDDNNIEINENLEDKNDKKGKKGKKEKTITFNDLINTLKSELDKAKKPKKFKNKTKGTAAVFELMEDLEEEEDISDIMEYLLKELHCGEIIFQKKFQNPKDIVKNFLPSLYLANDGTIEIYQKELFKEIILKCK